MDAQKSDNNSEDPIIPVSITLPKSLVASIDAQALKSDLNRSQYLRRLARADLAKQQAENKGPVAA